MNIKQLMVSILCLSIIFSFSGCGSEKKKESKLETDYQTSYTSNTTSWRNVQTDENGQYVNFSGFLYYYNEKNNTFAPVCEKVNCLHDKDPDKLKQIECNANIGHHTIVGDDNQSVWNDCGMIQYYEGYIYYVQGNRVYRLKKDGSKTDCVLKLKESISISFFLIHRGYLYYEMETNYTRGQEVYGNIQIYKLEIADHMNEKDAECLLDLKDTNQDFLGFGGFNASGDYVTYEYQVRDKTEKMEEDDWWKTKSYDPRILYNIRTGKKEEVTFPKKDQTPGVGIQTLLFLDKYYLVKLYDNTKEVDEKMPTYLVDYKTGKWHLWKDTLPQGTVLLTYKDYIIEENVDRAYHKKKKYADYTIYSLEGEKVANYKCPIYGEGEHEGFGPDGIQILQEHKGHKYNVYEVKFQDVLKLHGEKITPKRIGTMEDNTEMYDVMLPDEYWNK